MPDVGFLGTKAPFIFDLIIAILAAAVPLLAFSICMAKKGKRELHRLLQIVLTIAMFTAVGLFEWELHRRGGIFEIVPAMEGNSTFIKVLGVHLFFSITTVFIWAWTFFSALIRFRKGWDESYIPRHRFWAWLSTLDLVLTCITGLCVYVFAFMMTHS